MLFQYQTSTMTRPEAEAAVDLELQQTGLTRREWYRTVYLKSDHWKNLRTLALQHHGQKCHNCTATKRLDVHHIRYSSIYDIEVTDLQVLCRKCHDKAHEPAVVCTSETEKALKPARRKVGKATPRTFSGTPEAQLAQVYALLNKSSGLTYGDLASLKAKKKKLKRQIKAASKPKKKPKVHKNDYTRRHLHI